MLSRILIALTICLFAQTPVSFAQLPSLSQLGLGKTSSTPSAVIADLTKAKDQVASNYVQSSQTMSNALGSILSSLGGNNDLLGKLAAAKNLQPANLTSGSTSSVRQAVDAAEQFLKQKLQANPTLTPASTQGLTSGIASFVNGFSALKNLAPSVSLLGQKAQNALATAPLQDKMGVQGILSQVLPLAQSLPQDLASYKAVLSTLVSFASSHHIQLPAAAQALLK